MMIASWFNLGFSTSGQHLLLLFASVTSAHSLDIPDWLDPLSPCSYPPSHTQLHWGLCECVWMMLVVIHRIPRVFRYLWVGIFDCLTPFVNICYSVLVGSSLVLDFITWTLGSYTLPIRIIDCLLALPACRFDMFVNFIGFACSLGSSFLKWVVL